MRLLVAPHDLNIGGSQINAIDLAAGAAEAGHEVTVFGVPGPLVDLVPTVGSTSSPRARCVIGPLPPGSPSSGRSRETDGST